MARTNGGFDSADIDVELFDDPKVKRLVRSCETPEQAMTALGLYVAVVLGSWADGERVSIEDAAPIWWPGSTDAVASLLTRCGLLDDDGRIPEKAWDARFGSAHERREALRRKWSKDNDRRKAERATTRSDDDTTASRRGDDGVTTASRRGDDSVTTAPVLSRSVQPDQTTEVVPVSERSDVVASPEVTSGARRSSGATTDDVGRTKTTAPDRGQAPTMSSRALASWADFGPEWDGVKAAWLARGLRMAPIGSPDDEVDVTSQRSVLWEILDARPNDVERWIRVAPPGLSATKVVDYVLGQWHALRDTVTARVDAEEAEWSAAKLDDELTAPDALARIEAQL